MGCARSRGAAKISLPEIYDTILGAHFTGDHHNKTYSGVRFANCTFRQTQFDSCTFINCGFDDCAFEVAEFSRSTFDNCVFLSGTFEHGILLDNTMRSVTFGGVHMIQVGFDGGELDHLTLRGCRIEHVALKGLKLTGLNVIDCGNAQRLVLAVSEIRDAAIADTDLHESSVYRCQLHNARFREGRYALFEILESTLHGATFDQVDFQGSNLSDTTFTASVFEDCVFSRFLNVDRTRLQETRFIRTLVEKSTTMATDGLMTEGGDKLPGT